MKTVLFILCLLPALPGAAQDSTVTGTVTYIASGVVYTSLGRQSGIVDSQRVWVLGDRDTVAALRVVALSSKSSACSVMTSRGEIRMNARVAALVTRNVPEQAPAPVAVQIPQAEEATRPASAASSVPPAIELRGRISAQWRSVSYTEEAFNVTQPGMVVNLQARTADVPLELDLYANLRTVSYGTAGPFSRGAVNQSRVYRATVTYDNGSSSLSAGRVLPLQAWTLGTIDGFVGSHRLGPWKIGMAAGFQPEPGNRGVSTSARKFGLFTSWEPGGDRPGFFTVLYSRSYRRNTLDRETASGLANIALTQELMLYGSGELDLRRKEGSEYVLRPLLTTLYVNLNYRISRMLTMGAGVTGARPVYAFSDVRFVADSLLERRLVWGASLLVAVAPLPGLSLTNTFSPRTRLSGTMGDYTDYAAVTYAENRLTGIVFRADANLSRSEYTRTTGFGGGLQRQLPAGIDIALRYHRSQYTVLRTGAASSSSTYGADLVVPLASPLIVFGTYELFEGYGTRSHSIMAELSVRF